MTSRTCFYIFAAALAFVAATSAESTAFEESFAEATAFVQSFAAEGGDDSACAKVADDSIKTIKDECATLQNEVDRLAKGNQACCPAGKKAVCHAKWRMDKDGNLVKNCKKAVKDASEIRITGSISMGDLKRRSSCLSTIKQNSNYAAVAATLKKEKKKCEQTKGAYRALKKSYDDFVKDSDKGRKKCHDKSVTSAKKAFKRAKKVCESDKNKKAYARAMHMKCILAGTSLKDCKKVTTPTLKEAKMKAVKGYCKHVSMNCPAPTPTPTRSPTRSPTSAPTQTPTARPTWAPTSKGLASLTSATICGNQIEYTPSIGTMYGGAAYATTHGTYFATCLPKRYPNGPRPVDAKVSCWYTSARPGSSHCAPWVKFGLPAVVYSDSGFVYCSPFKGMSQGWNGPSAFMTIGIAVDNKFVGFSNARKVYGEAKMKVSAGTCNAYCDHKPRDKRNTRIKFPNGKQVYGCASLPCYSWGQIQPCPKGSYT